MDFCRRRVPSAELALNGSLESDGKVMGGIMVANQPLVRMAAGMRLRKGTIYN